VGSNRYSLSNAASALTSDRKKAARIQEKLEPRRYVANPEWLYLATNIFFTWALPSTSIRYR
jgi:hypothetical protein